MRKADSKKHVDISIQKIVQLLKLHNRISDKTYLGKVSF